VNVSDLAGSSQLPSLLAAAAPTSASAASSASPAAQAESLLASSQSALFSSLGGSSSAMPDLSGLTAAAQAYSLYTNPAMLRELAAGAAPASGASAASAPAVAAPPAYSFNPFDEASWWSSPGPSLGSTVDATA
jgi:hypothetical protein